MNFRKPIACILLIIPAVGALAQNKYESKFSLDAGLQVSRSTNLLTNEFGTGLFFEPRLSLGEKFKIGFRVQGDAFWGNGVTQSAKKYNVRAIGSYLLTAQYSFTDGNTRPFIGIGIGSFTQYHVSAAAVDRDITATDQGSCYGIVPRAGILFNRFQLFADTHINFRGTLTQYVSIGAGYTFGFGKSQ